MAERRVHAKLLWELTSELFEFGVVDANQRDPRSNLKDLLHESLSIQRVRRVQFPFFEVRQPKHINPHATIGGRGAPGQDNALGSSLGIELDERTFVALLHS